MFNIGSYKLLQTINRMICLRVSIILYGKMQEKKIVNQTTHLCT